VHRVLCAFGAPARRHPPVQQVHRVLCALGAPARRRPPVQQVHRVLCAFGALALRHPPVRQACVVIPACGGPPVSLVPESLGRDRQVAVASRRTHGNSGDQSCHQIAPDQPPLMWGRGGGEPIDANSTRPAPAKRARLARRAAYRTAKGRGGLLATRIQLRRPPAASHQSRALEQASAVRECRHDAGKVLPPDPDRNAPASPRKFVQERLRRAQIRGREALGESVIHRRQSLSRVRVAVPRRKQARQAGGQPQFPK